MGLRDVINDLITETMKLERPLERPGDEHRGFWTREWWVDSVVRRLPGPREAADALLDQLIEAGWLAAAEPATVTLRIVNVPNHPVDGQREHVQIIGPGPKNPLHAKWVARGLDAAKRWQVNRT